MIWIDYTDATPIYEQIVSKYKNLIVKGALEAARYLAGQGAGKYDMADVIEGR